MSAFEWPLANFRGFDARMDGPTEPEHEPAHVLQRPQWLCEACGESWPCEATRNRMLAEAEQDGASGPGSLAAMMWGFLEDYSRDAGPGPLADAFDRFIAWTRRDEPPRAWGSHRGAE